MDKWDKCFVKVLDVITLSHPNNSVMAYQIVRFLVTLTVIFS